MLRPESRRGGRRAAAYGPESYEPGTYEPGRNESDRNEAPRDQYGPVPYPPETPYGPTGIPYGGTGAPRDEYTKVPRKRKHRSDTLLAPCRVNPASGFIRRVRRRRSTLPAALQLGCCSAVDAGQRG